MPNYDVFYKKGNWKNDRLNGKGKTVFTDGQVFEGIYKNGKLTEGEFSVTNNGDLWTYKGEFNGNFFNGKGLERKEINTQVTIQRRGGFFLTIYIKA